MTENTTERRGGDGREGGTEVETAAMTGGVSAAGRWLLAIELVVVFGLGPLAFWLFLDSTRLLFPLLWLWMFACLGVMFAAKRFAWRQLGWKRGEMGSVLKSFAVLGGALAVAVVAWDLVDSYRDILFRLIRRDPGLWAAIMVGYPIASVYPQEVIFRAFFFDRYRPLFEKPWMIVAASAVAFAWVHIIFGNPIAVALTLPGGLIFAYRYLKTGSTLVVSVEHALYGCLIFTIGIGGYFYAG